MALRLASQGFSVIAWNRTAAKVEALVDAAAADRAHQVLSATAAEGPPSSETVTAAVYLSHGTVSQAVSPAEAIAASDVVVLMLADHGSIIEVVTGNAEAMGAMRGKAVVQMGTIGVERSDA